MKQIVAALCCLGCTLPAVADAELDKELGICAAFYLTQQKPKNAAALLGQAEDAARALYWETVYLDGSRSEIARAFCKELKYVPFAEN